MSWEAGSEYAYGLLWMTNAVTSNAQTPPHFLQILLVSETLYDLGHPLGQLGSGVPIVSPHTSSLPAIRVGAAGKALMLRAQLSKSQNTGVVPAQVWAKGKAQHCVGKLTLCPRLSAPRNADTHYSCVAFIRSTSVRCPLFFQVQMNFKLRLWN